MTFTDKFSGNHHYLATPGLAVAVNAAVALPRPLRVKGDPGTGKIALARQVARVLDAPIIEWHIKSTNRAQPGRYDFDAVIRLRDSQLGDSRLGAARVNDVQTSIRHGKLWQAFEASARLCC